MTRARPLQTFRCLCILCRPPPKPRPDAERERTRAELDRQGIQHNLNDKEKP